jgi:hypothetical protein
MGDGIAEDGEADGGALGAGDGGPVAEIGQGVGVQHGAIMKDEL